MIYDKTPQLNKFQKQKIKKRLMLDFYKELDKIDDEKEKFFKIFCFQIESLVNKFDNNGMLFYSLDIELPTNFDKNCSWEEIHEHVEDFINYIGSNIELVEFCYFSIEIGGILPAWQKKADKNLKVIKGNKNSFHLRGIIGVRSLLGKNKFLIDELRELFYFSFFNIEIKWLSSVLKVKEYWYFVIKQKNFKFHSFVNYSDFYPMVYGAIADEELKFEDNSAFGQVNHFVSDTMNIAGIQKKSPTKKQKILYLINLYMNYNNLFFYEDLIFSKVLNSRISWRPIYNLVDMKGEIQSIFDKVKSYYPQQLADFNAMDFMFNDFDSIFNKIKEINSLVPKIYFFDNIIEFSNGIYFFETKKFSSFIDLETSELLKYKTLLYINFDFDDSVLMLKMLDCFYPNYDKNNLI